ncbi:uncharacterized protein LOC131495591 [Neofelis nebulosa]|uniref:uncharacterized protein LOC131495591 n=1 Tax=Neofelis nebulosa TaxID=61452 RepID=UPI00272C5898|nr:uncharacterized protein LOC131495591 [Neofelis nebulosa]
MAQCDFRKGRVPAGSRRGCGSSTALSPLPSAPPSLAGAPASPYRPWGPPASSPYCFPSPILEAEMWSWSRVPTGSHLRASGRVPPCFQGRSQQGVKRREGWPLTWTLKDSRICHEGRGPLASLRRGFATGSGGWALCSGWPGCDIGVVSRCQPTAWERGNVARAASSSGPGLDGTRPGESGRSRTCWVSQPWHSHPQTKQACHAGSSGTWPQALAETPCGVRPARRPAAPYPPGPQTFRLAHLTDKQTLERIEPWPPSMGRLADFLELVSFEHRRIPALPGVLGEISRELELEVPTDSATCPLNGFGHKSEGHTLTS